MRICYMLTVACAVLMTVGPRLAGGVARPGPSRRLSHLLYSSVPGSSRWRSWASSHRRMNSLMKMNRHRYPASPSSAQPAGRQGRDGKLHGESGQEAKKKYERALEILKLALQLLNDNEKQRTARDTPNGNAHSRANEEEGNVTLITNDRELCHARALRKCAQKVIEVFERETVSLNQKCDTREGFLKCMIHQKNKPCHPHHHHAFSKEALKMLRQKVLHLLWSARGCVFGIDVSTG